MSDQNTQVAQEAASEAEQSAQKAEEAAAEARARVEEIKKLSQEAVQKARTGQAKEKPAATSTES